MKTCSKCGDPKPLAMFYKDKGTKDGLYRWCKDCASKQNRDWHELNKRDYTKRDVEANRKHAKEWAAANRPRRVFAQTKRRINKISSTPKWLTKEQLELMVWFYGVARSMTKLTGIPHQVDHIHPLQGRSLSGLHVPWNLRVIPASENAAKGNKVQAFVE